MRWIKLSTDVKQVFKSEEIYLKDFFLIFWERRIYVIISSGLFVLLGVIAVFSSKEIYESQSTMLLESPQAKTKLQLPSNLGGVSGLLGITSNSNEGVASADFEDPAMYNRLLSSRPFLLELMEEQFYFPMYGDTLTLREFFVRYDDRNLIQRTTGWFKGLIGIPLRLFEKKGEKYSNQPIVGVSNTRVAMESRDDVFVSRITESQELVISRLNQAIDVKVSGVFITVSTSMPDPLLSAQFNDVVFKKLIEYATEKQIAKEKRDLEIVKSREEVLSQRFRDKQKEYADYLDQNRGVVSEVAKIKEQQIKYEYDLYFNIYNSIAVQLENKKLQLEEKTPIYSVFEPVYVPNKAKSTSRKAIILYFALGIFFGGLIMLLDILWRLAN